MAMAGVCELFSAIFSILMPKHNYVFFFKILKVKKFSDHQTENEIYSFSRFLNSEKKIREH